MERNIGLEMKRREWDIHEVSWHWRWYHRCLRNGEKKEGCTGAVDELTRRVVIVVLSDGVGLVGGRMDGWIGVGKMVRNSRRRTGSRSRGTDRSRDRGADRGRDRGTNRSRSRSKSMDRSRGRSRSSLLIRFRKGRRWGWRRQ